MNNPTQLVPMLEAVVSYIDEGVLIADKNGQVLYQNPAVGDLLGLPNNQPVQRLQDIGELNLQRAILRAAIDAGEVDAAGKPSGRFVRFEQSICPGGQQRHLEFNTGLVDCIESKDKLRLVLIRDRTEHHRLQSLFASQQSDFQTKDPAMTAVVERIHQIAGNTASVLLQGESGTGKTQLARLIHRLSQRAKHPFVELNCAAIPETLLETELFGHVKGAFTGAHQQRAGRFQAAHRGTLFLDEVSEIPLHLQAKLLRAIQDQQFEMVGSDRTVDVDVRILAASNRNLRELVDKGEFRADLFYRLAVIPLTVPALRDRVGDIPLLIQHFGQKLAAQGYAEDTAISPEAMRLLVDYPWPGNVRELQNAVEHGFICAVQGQVVPASLPPDIRTYFERQGEEDIDSDGEQQMLVQAAQIRAALQEARGSKVEAAKILGIDRSTLWRRMQRLGIAEHSR